MTMRKLAAEERLILVLLDKRGGGSGIEHSVHTKVLQGAFYGAMEAANGDAERALEIARGEAAANGERDPPPMTTIPNPQADAERLVHPQLLGHDYRGRRLKTAEFRNFRDKSC